MLPVSERIIVQLLFFHQNPAELRRFAQFTSNFSSFPFDMAKSDLQGTDEPHSLEERLQERNVGILADTLHFESKPLIASAAAATGSN